MSYRLIRNRLRATVRPVTLAAAALLLASAASAQEPAVSDSTVTYPAEFFAQYEPFSVSDMLSRIPGINLAMGGGNYGASGGGGGGRGGGKVQRRGKGFGRAQRAP